MTFVVPLRAGSDWHSGWSIIPPAQIIRIERYKQSVTFGTLEIQGSLYLEGRLILER
jgi:hypothetical protein